MWRVPITTENGRGVSSLTPLFFQTKLQFTKQLFLKVAFLSLLFLSLRFFEIFLHRSYLFEEPLWLIHRLSVSLFLDFLTFFIINIPYIYLNIFCERKKKDLHFLIRRSFFILLNAPIFILFFLDMQSIATQNNLFSMTLLSAFKWEMVLNGFVFIKDYWYLALTACLVSLIIFKISNKRKLHLREVI